MTHYTSRPIEERFWEKVAIEVDGCWNWTGSRSTTGYGQTYLRGKVRVASRVSWELSNGVEPPAGIHVCHHCDNPLCVRPDHLFLGTNRENMQDAARKKRCGAQTKPERLARGERHGIAKLTDELVVAMRRLHNSGEPFTEIAKSFGISESAARQAIKGVTWSHVPFEFGGGV